MWNAAVSSGAGLLGLQTAYESIIQGRKASNTKIGSPSKIAEGLGDTVPESKRYAVLRPPLKLTASQNLLRVKLSEIKRRDGLHDGLNVALECRDARSLERPSFEGIDMVAMGICKSASRPRVAQRSMSRLSFTSSASDSSFQTMRCSSRSVFDVEEDLDFASYAEDDDISDNEDDDDNDSTLSVVSFYANPNYGRGQRIQMPGAVLGPTLENTGEPEMQPQESTQVLLSPLISDPAMDVQDSAAQLSVSGEDAEGDDELDACDNPSLITRHYTRQLSVPARPGQLHQRSVATCQELLRMSAQSAMYRVDSIVSNIPCDSWMALPLRVLPGHLVPHGLIIFVLPIMLTVFSILTLLFLCKNLYW